MRKCYWAELNQTRAHLANVQQNQTLNIKVCNGEIKAVLFARRQARNMGSYRLKPEYPNGF